MQITAADIDQLNPPTEAADLMRQADAEGHTLWAGWQTNPNNTRLFGVRIDGPGWDIVAIWSAPQKGDPYLSSLLISQGAVGKWEHASLDEARKHISGDA